MAELDMRDVIVGGVQPDDHWHIMTDDGTCSRCRKEPPEEDVPLLLWDSSGNNMLRYCEACLAVGRMQYDARRPPQTNHKDSADG